MTDKQWQRMFKRLSDDISDRRGLKWEWTQIDKDVMRDEIKPTWRKIIEEVLERGTPE